MSRPDVIFLFSRSREVCYPDCLVADQFWSMRHHLAASHMGLDAKSPTWDSRLPSLLNSVPCHNEFLSNSEPTAYSERSRRTLALSCTQCCHCASLLSDVVMISSFQDFYDIPNFDLALFSCRHHLHPNARVLGVSFINTPKTFQSPVRL